MSEGLTYIQARDLMYAYFNGMVSNHAARLCGYTPYVKWPGLEPEAGEAGIEDDGKIDASKHHYRIQKQPIKDTVIGHTAPANIKFEPRKQTGILSIELFAPRSDDEAYDIMEQFSQIVKNSFRLKRLWGSLWFKSAVGFPLDPSDNSYRYKVTVEYQYLEVQDPVLIAIDKIQDLTGSLVIPWLNSLETLSNDKFI